MSTSLKAQVASRQPNAPHIALDAAAGSASGMSPRWQGRVLIQIPDLSGPKNEPNPGRKVQRLIGVLKELQHRPRTLVASGIVLVAVALVMASAPWGEKPDSAALTEAPEFDPFENVPRKAEPAAPTVVAEVPNVSVPAPQVLLETPLPPAPTDAAPALVDAGPAIPTIDSALLATPGVAQLLGEIIPESLEIEAAQHETSGPGLH